MGRFLNKSEEIRGYFEAMPVKVFKSKDLEQVLDEKGADWGLSPATSVGKFIRELEKLHFLKEVELEAPAYGRTDIRYVWGDGDHDLELGLTLRKKSYYSHGSALFVHGLVDGVPGCHYVNAEQSVKPRSDFPLTQGGIDRAFRSQARTSKYLFHCESTQFCLLSGKNTGNLGVEIMTFQGQQIAVTNLERTLVDVAVRPAYSGGCAHVLEAYRRANGRVSVDSTLGILAKLDYVYPYHQAIGFYMQTAGYGAAEVAKFKSMGQQFDFYLDYAMDGPSYSPEWRIHYPGDLR